MAFAAIEFAVWMKIGTLERRSYQTKAQAATAAAAPSSGRGTPGRARLSRRATRRPSSPGPIRFIGLCGPATGGLVPRLRRASRPAQATIAIIGRLIQNTQRQPTVPVRIAPRAGPISAETPHIAALIPNARGRRESGTEIAKRPRGTANMKPAPAPRIAREAAITVIEGARPPITLAVVKRMQAMAKLRPTPCRSITAPATGNVIATVTVVAPTVIAISPTPPMSWAAVGSAVVTISASSDPRKVAPRAATMSAR